ncbi:hypothetical protein [Saccharothrix syringae]|uniref:Secreted protein n=1 Tax=Saccharothrix syringae TaxID=103733 RepID=A0A5Q0H499_SACSY|nr:hypothetical protein [Saccharothrix syringae]QFZ21051.1 hypothetical protein EKG83_29990 [Saccharothrix syringae]
MRVSLSGKSAAIAAGFVVAAGLMGAGSASARPVEVGPLAQACTNFYMGSGHVNLCKTWVWDGNDYDGRWWVNGPSDLPGGSYLQRREDGGTPINSPWSGSYNDRDEVLFRVCNSLLGCTDWW